MKIIDTWESNAHSSYSNDELYYYIKRGNIIIGILNNYFHGYFQRVTIPLLFSNKVKWKKRKCEYTVKEWSEIEKEERIVDGRRNVIQIILIFPSDQSVTIFFFGLLFSKSSDVQLGN